MCEMASRPKVGKANLVPADTPYQRCTRMTQMRNCCSIDKMQAEPTRTLLRLPGSWSLPPHLVELADVAGAVTEEGAGHRVSLRCIEAACLHSEDVTHHQRDAVLPASKLLHGNLPRVGAGPSSQERMRCKLAHRANHRIHAAAPCQPLCVMKH